jgi:hypothetical protein
MTTSALRILGAGLLACTIAVLIGPATAADTVQALIDRLDSDRFADREAADKALRALETVPPELRAACQSSKREVRLRARRIVAAIEARIAVAIRREIERLVERGEVDQAVEWAVRWGRIDPAGTFALPFMALLDRVREAEKKRFGKLDHLGLREWSSAIEKQIRKGDTWTGLRSSVDALELREEFEMQPGIIRAAGLTILRSKGLSPTYNLFFVLSSESVVGDAFWGLPPIVLTGGSVEFNGAPRAGGRTVIADGDVKLQGIFRKCLLIARGNIELSRGSLDQCAVIAGGDIRIPSIQGCSSVLVAGGRVHIREPVDPHTHKCLIRENDRVGLGILKFFDPKQAGLEATPGPRGVRLTSVRKGTPFYGRLLADDVITAIDGEPTPGPGPFRRALRRALAGVGTDAAFRVLRRGETHVVKVRIPSLQAAPAKAGLPIRP